MTEDKRNSPVPDDRSTPKEKDEFLRIFDALSDGARAAILLFARRVARDQGVASVNVQRVATDRNE